MENKIKQQGTILIITMVLLSIITLIVLNSAGQINVVTRILNAEQSHQQQAAILEERLHDMASNLSEDKSIQFVPHTYKMHESLGLYYLYNQMCMKERCLHSICAKPGDLANAIPIVNYYNDQILAATAFWQDQQIQLIIVQQVGGNNIRLTIQSLGGAVWFVKHIHLSTQHKLILYPVSWQSDQLNAIIVASDQRIYYHDFQKSTSYYHTVSGTIDHLIVGSSQNVQTALLHVTYQGQRATDTFNLGQNLAFVSRFKHHSPQVVRYTNWLCPEYTVKPQQCLNIYTQKLEQIRQEPHTSAWFY